MPLLRWVSVWNSHPAPVPHWHLQDSLSGTPKHCTVQYFQVPSVKASYHMNLLLKPVKGREKASMKKRRQDCGWLPLQSCDRERRGTLKMLAFGRWEWGTTWRKVVLWDGYPRSWEIWDNATLRETFVEPQGLVSSQHSTKGKTHKSREGFLWSDGAVSTPRGSGDWVLSCVCLI